MSENVCKAEDIMNRAKSYMQPSFCFGKKVACVYDIAVMFRSLTLKTSSIRKRIFKCFSVFFSSLKV